MNKLLEIRTFPGHIFKSWQTKSIHAIILILKITFSEGDYKNRNHSCLWI